MSRSIYRSKILPFYLLFGTLIVATWVADILLHQFDLVWIGRYLGIPGTILIILSFLYSLRKRKMMKSGNPGTLLMLHEVLAWLGSWMILVHAGIHFNAILPWLALAAMLINVASGLTGKYLLDKARRSVETRKGGLLEQGLTEEYVEKQLFWDAVTVDMMRKWRQVHFPITLAFVVLSSAHVISIFLFWEWK